MRKLAIRVLVFSRHTKERFPDRMFIIHGEKFLVDSEAPALYFGNSSSFFFLFTTVTYTNRAAPRIFVQFF